MSNIYRLARSQGEVKAETALRILNKKQALHCSLNTLLVNRELIQFATKIKIKTFPSKISADVT